MRGAFFNLQHDRRALVVYLWYIEDRNKSIAFNIG